MIGHLYRTGFLLLFSFLFFFSEAQKVKSTKKNNTKEEEVEKPPPPPRVEMIEVRIDTSSFAEVTPKTGYTREDLFFNFPDTSSAPNDELTNELRKFLTMSGAFDLGIQFAKMMTNDNETERNGLPKEFYKKMYEEMSLVETKKMFENEVIKIYRKYYTLEEVKEIISFYSTNTGMKVLKSLPLLMDESQKIGAEFGKVIGMKVYNDLLKEGKIK